MNTEHAVQEMQKHVSIFGDQLLADELERRGYVVAKPGDPPPEVEYSIHDKLRNRMECLASDLQIIDGMTKKGGVLDRGYIYGTLQSLRRYANCIFEALEHERPVWNDWDRSE